MDVEASALPISGVSQALLAFAGVYRGWALRETAGAVATVRLYDNATAASGTLLDTIELGANESGSEWLAGGGLRFANGIYVSIVAGAVEGSVRVG
ncbi:MAG: hypothetical protein QOD63_1494 [Actinomycetota bacterium]|jgi:hypothetical protein|nr:hypothetical protein [Actinomycetota bacterium]